MKHEDFNYKEHGFVGHLTEPDGGSDKAVIVIMEENRYVTDVEKDRKKVKTVRTSGVGVGDVIVCLMLVIFSVAGFIGGNVILGYLAGVPAVLLFPYLTFKRPFFKADAYGILIRRSTNFGYGKARFIDWEQVEAIIDGDKIFRIDESNGGILENKLNAETLSELSIFDVQTEEEYEDQAEWIENGFFIVIKPSEKGKSGLLDLGSLFRYKDFREKPEMIKALWQYHLKSNPQEKNDR